MPRKLALLSCLLVVWLAGSATAGHLSPGLEAQFAQKQDDAPVKVLVVLRDRVDIQALDWNLHEQRVDLATRHVTVIETLKDAARGVAGATCWSTSPRARTAARSRSSRRTGSSTRIMVTATEAVIREIAGPRRRRRRRAEPGPRADRAGERLRRRGRRQGRPQHRHHARRGQHRRPARLERARHPRRGRPHRQQRHRRRRHPSRPWPTAGAACTRPGSSAGSTCSAPAPSSPTTATATAPTAPAP